jgi:tRNA (guanine37-N1)-methyltransferase
MLEIDILTLFPKMFAGVFSESLIGKAQKKELVKIRVHNLRDWAKDKHKTTDDRPFGGGPGMVLKPEPIWAAVKELQKAGLKKESKVLLLTPQGRMFNQRKAEELSEEKQLILICGHYEGVDERVREALVDEEVSIGDYVLSGGELPAAVVTEAVVRLIPGVVGKEESLIEESFSKGLLEYPQYTQPANFLGHQVPKVLTSGNQEEIRKWRQRQALVRTKNNRPDLFEKYTKRSKKR